MCLKPTERSNCCPCVALRRCIYVEFPGSLFESIPFFHFSKLQRHECFLPFACHAFQECTLPKLTVPFFAFFSALGAVCPVSIFISCNQFCFSFLPSHTAQALVELKPPSCMPGVSQLFFLGLLCEDESQFSFSPFKSAFLACLHEYCLAFDIEMLTVGCTVKHPNSFGVPKPASELWICCTWISTHRSRCRSEPTMLGHGYDCCMVL